jgi:hypothetical protein
MAHRDRGQTLVIFAVLIPVLVLFFLFALGLAAVLDVRAHAEYALSVATRAGARQVEYASYGDGGAQLDPDAVEVKIRQVFRDALALRTTGLADVPENIASQTQVEIGYGTPGQFWYSSFNPYRGHPCPTVAARAWVPIRVWLFDISTPIVVETEVR